MGSCAYHTMYHVYIAYRGWGCDCELLLVTGSMHTRILDYYTGGQLLYRIQYTGCTHLYTYTGTHTHSTHQYWLSFGIVHF